MKSKREDDYQDIDTSRTETFSDGVLAIIITIMVLELEIPDKPTFESLKHSLPMFFAYILSFIFIGIYWNNHHHMFRALKRVSAGVMWSNLLLLFWLSLIPFVTSWVGNFHEKKLPAAIYGFVCIMAALSYTVLVYFAKRCNKDTKIAELLGRDLKGKISLSLYVLGTLFSFFHPYFGYFCYVIVTLAWFIPDKRVISA
ncbi:MAG: TMEM175 family protein [Acidimicrobiia bacterium]